MIDGSVGATLHKMMTDRGLWPKEADAVLESLKVSNPALAECLHKQWEEYPLVLHTTAWMVVKGAVVDYIDKNKPLHWARPMFAE